MQQKKHAVIPEDIAGKHSSKRASSVRTRPIPVSFRVISIVPSTLLQRLDKLWVVGGCSQCQGADRVSDFMGLGLVCGWKPEACL